MNIGTTNKEDQAMELPATAPLVRVTAGAGSAGQKTWNIRRPVTLIGARRPAHIVLHDKDISKVHCVLINTGTDVLLKDLGSSVGTLCNNDRVDLTVLSDGDVVSVGSTKIQVAIRLPQNDNDDSDVGEIYLDPLKFDTPVSVRLDPSSIEWNIEDAAAVIGRHESTAIRLEHEDVSTRHALIFKFGNSPAIFDLGGRTGMCVNGLPCRISRLTNGDRIGIGPCTLLLESGASADGQTPSSESHTSGFQHQSNPFDGTPPSDLASDLSTMALAFQDKESIDFDATQVVAGEFAKIDEELSTLHTDISESWGRLNNWETRLRGDAARLSNREQDLQDRKQEVEAKDAAMRGQLHDLTRFTEQITTRERELSALLSKVKAEQVSLVAEKAERLKREDDLARRSTELKRREHVLAQRWARLLAANCPHCGKPVRINNHARSGVPGQNTP